VPGATAAREWPEHGLDVEAQRARGWRPVPLQQLVLKLAGPCNLACDYCYVYAGADQSWRDRPAVAPLEVVTATARRVAEHAERHGLTGLGLVLHGGEPLLAGPQRIEQTLQALSDGMPAGFTLRFSVQTNGLLLTDRMLDLLAAYDVHVGVSLDGAPAHHDLHRVDHRGRGSHAAVARNLRTLANARYRHLFSGLLATIDPRHDPVAVYEGLLEFQPPQLDLLLPHRTWEQTPPGYPVSSPGSTPYGDWLVAVFDRWFTAPRRETVVRLFDDILRLVLGGHATSGQVGLSPAAFAVVDTDGTLQQIDALKVVAPGAPGTGLTVFDHTLDDVCAHPGIVARQLGLAALADDCQACPIVRVCGGGHYPHRYRPGSGFRNPSVYCPDLQVLIRHVIRGVRRAAGRQSPVSRDLPRGTGAVRRAPPR
jgi:uncharacterized protein